MRAKHPVILGAALSALFAGTAAAQALECTLIADAATGKELYRKGTCDKAFAPMSTFKVPLAVMGYDAGILVDAHNPSWDYKPEFEGYKSQQKTTDPTIWEKDSIVWYSQELTRKLGDKRFAGYVTGFGYGNRDVSGDPGKNNGLTHSWLASSLKISPEGQVRFVRDLLSQKLPASKAAQQTTVSILPRFNAGYWDVQGKTGTGSFIDARGAKAPLGWFIGWATHKERRIVFARMTAGGKKGEQPAGPAARDAFLKALPDVAKAF